MMRGETLRLDPLLLHILIAVADEPAHGYAILQSVRDRAGDSVRVGPSSLYWSLGRLERAGLLEEVAAPVAAAPVDPRRKFFALTEAGRRRLRIEMRELEKLVTLARGSRLIGRG